MGMIWQKLMTADNSDGLVVIEQTEELSGESDGSGLVIYLASSIGSEAADRIVVVSVACETASGNNGIEVYYFNGVTYIPFDYQGTQGENNAIYARCAYHAFPSGTTIDLVVFFDSSISATQHRIAMYKVTGSDITTVTSGSDGSTDMDATDPLTTGSITIPANGGFIAVAGGATDTVAKTWANATEGIDVDAGGFRFTTATRTTALTAAAVTCTGGTNGEDGALSYLIFSPA